MKSKSKQHSGGKKSSNITRPGTGSGIGVKAGSTNTPTSEPADNHTMGRKGNVKALT